MTDEVEVLSVQDMIQAARDESPSGFEAAFNDTIMSKIADAVEKQRETYAQNFLTQPEEVVDAGVEEQESDQETTTEAENQDENTEADNGSEASH